MEENSSSESSARSRAYAIFHYRAISRKDELVKRDAKFVHYTSAESALSIIKNNCVWMRHTSFMNDFSEVDYGLSLLRSAYLDERSVSFRKVLNEIILGFDSLFQEVFNNARNILRHETYIACISEHQPSEDDIGRLSMWRAYGTGSGVALVLNNGPFIRPSTALLAYTFPVNYDTVTEAIEELINIAQGIKANMDFFISIPQILMNTVLNFFAVYALSTKHPGFTEEKEWRIISTPIFGDSERLIKHFACIRGIPQMIRQIPLQNIPDEGFYGVEINDLLYRLIIGPTASPYPQYVAFSALLEQAGVLNANDRVQVSDIPLRKEL